MNVSSSTLSLTVADVDASRRFLHAYLGYEVTRADDGFASLTRGDAAVDVVLLRAGTEILPPEQRDRRAAGLILALTVTDLAAEETRLRAAGAPITMPLREEPWGERLFQMTDPNGVVVQLVEWAADAHPVDADPAATDPVDDDVSAAMRVISPSADHVTVSPNATMTGLAAPSRGSAALSTWTVTMNAGATGPEHSVDREQVWTVTAGALEVTCDGRSEKVTAGQTLILPPNLLRRVHAPEQAAAHVSMPAGGVASVPGTDGTRELPWAR
ncbi:cupin domain-containing protein [Streptomyces sp. R302]|uniref:VOC family protein n=1 Tax=unclassified Streptomyces TaxID=2593676 RepID=UPI00145CB700|nr:MULTISPECIES: VOC family protein [unclassified Streptomyces]NML48985.1 cupin domain-containing protein [Streptomyces sp. R301]NML77312.1 cupin domain-containing protein [Streptomyces sp. R302]